MFRFLHAADIHLDSPLLKLEQYEGAPTEALRGATRKAFRNLTQLAIAESVDFVLISGDLYDGEWKDYNTGLYFVSLMAKLREAGIPVFIVAGNHDAASKMTKTLRLPENVRFFPTDKSDTIRLDKLGVAIHGQGFSTPAVRKDLSAAYPPPISGYFNIGMLHTGATGRENHEPYAPCTIEGLKSKGYDYWALGHVHQQEILCYEPLIVFPGNIQGRHIRETGVKGCMMVSVNETVSAEFRASDVIRWEMIEADSSGDPHELLHRIDERLRELCEKHEGITLAVRIGISDNHDALAAEPERWKENIRALASDSGMGRVWVEKIKFHGSRQPISGNSSELRGPVGEITRIFEELRSDPSGMKALADSLDDLMIKLPRELREGSEAVFQNNGAWMEEILKDAEPMLLRRLMKSDLTHRTPSKALS